MLQKIIEASVNNRFLVIVFTVLIAMAGVYAMFRYTAFGRRAPG